MSLLGWGRRRRLPGHGPQPTAAPRPRTIIETDLPPITVDFRDVAEQAGLTAPVVSGREDRKQYILEATGTGVAIFDFDNDGLMDVFVASAQHPGAAGRRCAATTSRLYRNLGRLRFADVTAKAGLDRGGWAQGVCVGDYDNDSHRDLFVTHYGRSVLYRNSGRRHVPGRHRGRRRRPAGVRWETGCTFVDYDLDGRLDLAVTSYLEFDRAKVPVPGSSGYCLWKGMRGHVRPARSAVFAQPAVPEPRRRQVRRRLRMRAASGSAPSCYAFTVVATDATATAIPISTSPATRRRACSMSTARDGTFEEDGLLAGVALNADGQEQGGMGVAVADYDDDGHLDIAKTNFSDDVPNLYRNNGDGVVRGSGVPVRPGRLHAVRRLGRSLRWTSITTARGIC